MEKETFANELDRLLSPFIDIIIDKSPAVGPDKDSDEPTRFQCEIPGSGLVVTWECLDRKQSETLVTLSDETVYRRFNGRTYGLRPGAWIWRLFEYGWALTHERTMDELADAIVSVNDKAVQFAAI